MGFLSWREVIGLDIDDTAFIEKEREQAPECADGVLA